MKIRFINLYALALISVCLFCSCSSDSGRGGQVFTVVMFIFLFVGASLLSAVITFRSRRKQLAEKDEKNDSQIKKE